VIFGKVEYRNLEQKMGVGFAISIFLIGCWKLFLNSVQKKKTCIWILGKFVLGCFCRFGLGLFAGWGSKVALILEKAVLLFLT
jgi:hypothetical protein